jgi:hypothetical protein
LVAVGDAAVMRDQSPEDLVVMVHRHAHGVTLLDEPGHDLWQKSCGLRSCCRKRK